MAEEAGEADPDSACSAGGALIGGAGGRVVSDVAAGEQAGNPARRAR
jgi:hypothetical protein